jgi:anti-anti-sigma regulatory factor
VIEVRHDIGARPPALVFVEPRPESTRDLVRALRTAVAAGNVRLVVDLGERRDTTSEVLTLLRRAAMQLRRLGGGLAVVSSQPDLRRLIDLTLLSQTFPVFATRDEALRDWR